MKEKILSKDEIIDILNEVIDNKYSKEVSLDELDHIMIKLGIKGFNKDCNSILTTRQIQIIVNVLNKLISKVENE